MWLPLIFAKFSEPASQPTSRPPGKVIFGNACRPPLVIARAPYASAFAAFEVLADQRVMLEALELFERAQMRVGVAEIDDQADAT